MSKEEESSSIQINEMKEFDSETQTVSLKDESKDVDVGLKYSLAANETEITEEEFAGVRRKIDWHILPIMMLVSLFQYWDKSTLSYSVLYGLREDLGLTPSQYSWVNSIFFFGYLVWQYPGAYLFQRLPAGRYISANVFLWGTIVTLMAATQNFAGIATLRFLTGAFEAIIVPGFIVLTNMWYTRKEQPLRFGLWYWTNGLASIIGGLVGYGAGHFEGNLEKWRYQYFIPGGLTIVASIISLFFLPNNPTTAYFLNEREKKVAIKRVADNNTGIETKKFKRYQAIEALTEPWIWLSAIGVGAGNVMAGIAGYSGLLVRSFGFSALQSQLLSSIPVGVIEIIIMMVVTFLVSRYPNKRIIGILAVTSVALVGAIMLYAINVTHKWAAITGLWIVMSCMPTSFVLGLSLMSSNIAGHTKKLTANAMLFVVYCVGNIVGPQLYKKAPYKMGLRANIVVFVVSLVTKTMCFFLFRHYNKQRRRYLDEHPELRIEDYQLHDLTDKENPFFIYAY